MAHEIKEFDNVVLSKKQAWHGLGLVVEDAPTPREALTLAGLEWGVEQLQLQAKLADGTVIDVPSHVLNYRADAKVQLGVVSSNYQPISNVTMADFCEALRDEGDVRVETAGSIQNGKRVWFLLEGEKFEVARGDQICPYILVSNGHDGMTSFRVTPTTVRVVCSNTLHGVVPRIDSGELLKSALSLKHTVNVMERVQQAKEALRYYGKVMQATQDLANSLAAKPVTSQAVQEFFLECYTADFGEVPENPKDGVEERRRARAMSAYNSFSRRFDDEREIAGASWWNAFNAYSGLVQHDCKARGANDADRIERRVDSNLFGLNQDRTYAALKRAFQKSLAG